MKRKVITGLIILSCFLLESTVLHSLTFASISPNLMLIIVASFGFMRGKKEGMTIIPLRIYFNNDNRVKLEIALAKGKHVADKRASIKEKDMKRDILKNHKDR